MWTICQPSHVGHVTLRTRSGTGDPPGVAGRRLGTLHEEPVAPLRPRGGGTFFKAFLFDVGILAARLGVVPQVFCSEAGYPQISSAFRGGIVENYVKQALVAAGVESQYWSSGNLAEVDFGVVDLRSGAVHMIELGSSLPYYVQARDGLVYVAHTFINPGFGEFPDFRRLSVVDATTEAVTSYDLKDGITKFSVGARVLAVLGEDAEENAILHTYDPKTMELLTRTQLTPPELSYARALNVFVAQR